LCSGTLRDRFGRYRQADVAVGAGKAGAHNYIMAATVLGHRIRTTAMARSPG
jgi:hypothetical protein